MKLKKGDVKMGRKFGFSFSWKRATGISSAKNKISRKIGVPLTRSGRRKKVGRAAGCFIATATYGDEDHYKVRYLRKYRDEILSKTKIGSLLIDFYYLVSPFLAKIVKNISLLRLLSRIILNRIIQIIEANTHLNKDNK